MTLTLLLCGLLSANPVVETPLEKPPTAPGPWELYLGAMGGLRPDSLGGGGVGGIGINRRLTSWLRPEFYVGLGMYSAPVQLLHVFRVGARIEWAAWLNAEKWPIFERLHPYLWIAFAHHHETPLDHVAMQPVGAFLGISEHGVMHRSGLDTGLGVSWDVPPRRGSSFGGRIGGRVSVTHLMGSGPPRYLDATVTVGLTF